MDSSASSPSSSTSFRHVRSISLPSRLHPNTLQVEKELTHLQTCAASLSSMVTVDIVSGSLERLERLYTSVNDLFSLPLTQQALLKRKDEKLVDELLDRLMGLLDVCGSTKDAMQQIKEHVRNVQSAIRRNKGDLKVDTSSIIRKMKEAKRSISALKQFDNKIGSIALLDKDHHLSAVITSLRGISGLSVSIFGSLLSLKTICVPKQKSTKWSLVSNLIHKRVSVDQPQISHEALESHIEVIENSLEGIFRTLIKTRVSLLNIRSQ